VYYDVPGFQAQTSQGDRPDDRSHPVPQYLGGVLEVNNSWKAASLSTEFRD